MNVLHNKNRTLFNYVVYSSSTRSIDGLSSFSLSENDLEISLGIEQLKELLFYRQDLGNPILLGIGVHIKNRYKYMVP